MYTEELLDTAQPLTLSMKGHEVDGEFLTVWKEYDELMGTPSLESIYGEVGLDDKVPRFLYVNHRDGMPRPTDVTIRLSDKRKVTLKQCVFVNTPVTPADRAGYDYKFATQDYELFVPSDADV